MDDSTLLALLERLDDPQNMEGLRLRDGVETNRLRKCIATLKNKLGSVLKIEAGSEIQDASFHCQVSVSPSGEGMPWLRFSNFGDMAAIHEDDDIPHDRLAQIVQILEAHGYVYIPFRLLERPYPRAALAARGVRDYWTRYFDWL